MTATEATETGEGLREGFSGQVESTLWIAELRREKTMDRKAMPIVELAEGVWLATSPHQKIAV
jgi:hypothetical protein